MGRDLRGLSPTIPVDFSAFRISRDNLVTTCCDAQPGGHQGLSTPGTLTLVAGTVIAARTGDPVVPSTAHFDDPHKFGVEAMTPPVTAAVGSARTARVRFWPALKDLSMYSL